MESKGNKKKALDAKAFPGKTSSSRDYFFFLVPAAAIESAFALAASAAAVESAFALAAAASIACTFATESAHLVESAFALAAASSLALPPPQATNARANAHTIINPNTFFIVYRFFKIRRKYTRKAQFKAIAQEIFRI
jgi:hypothetical protein